MAWLSWRAVEGTGKVHYARGPGVVLAPEGEACVRLGSILRPEDPACDQVGQAAVVLRGLPVPCRCRHVPAVTAEGAAFRQ